MQTSVPDKKRVSGPWPYKKGSLTRQMTYKCTKSKSKSKCLICKGRYSPYSADISVKCNIMKKLACGLGDPLDGLHDLPLERINWNAADPGDKFVTDDSMHVPVLTCFLGI